MTMLRCFRHRELAVQKGPPMGSKMKTRVLVVAALLALGAGCNKKKPQEGTDPPVLPVSNLDTGSGSAKQPKPDAKLVERGDYLSKMLGCVYCHAGVDAKGLPDSTRPFEGGFEVTEKFGKWRSPNITPHPGSGIGNWKDDEIAAAIREGVRPGGKQLYPIMPYLNYNRMTDDDVKALVAYLKTVKPIDNVVQPNNNLKLPQPVARRPANAPDPAGDSMKHGEYLVTLMHCGMCHTPVGKDGMPDMTKAFSGGFELELPMLGTGKLYGSNITSDPTTGIGKWTQTDVETSIKTLVRPDKTIIQGPMQFYLSGWSQMKDEDLKAIATYVKAIPPIKNKVAKSTFKPAAMGAGAGSAAGSGSAATGSGSGSSSSSMKPSPVEAPPPAAGSGSASKGSAATPAGSGSAKK
jgi:mono/diheme cytochrome c family protein